MDPHTYNPNEFFSNNWVYEGLVEYGPEGQILPALAKSWSIKDAADGGQVYTFQLREDVKFHDGAPWNCAAAKMNFDHVLAGVLKEPVWHGWYGVPKYIKSWECSEDDMELILTTKTKFYPFLQELTLFGHFASYRLMHSPRVLHLIHTLPTVVNVDGVLLKVK